MGRALRPEAYGVGCLSVVASCFASDLTSSVRWGWDPLSRSPEESATQHQSETQASACVVLSGRCACSLAARAVPGSQLNRKREEGIHRTHLSGPLLAIHDEGIIGADCEDSRENGGACRRGRPSKGQDPTRMDSNRQRSIGIPRKEKGSGFTTWGVVCVKVIYRINYPQRKRDGGKPP